MGLISERTRRDLRKRINHEKLLSFSGSRQFDFTGVSYTHFSCIVHVKSQNGNFIGAQTVASLGIPTSSQRVITGSAIGTILSNVGTEDYEVSNLVLYDRALTDEEFSYIKHLGGVVPASAHSNVVAHYTFNKASFFKADSSFAAKHANVSLNDLVVFDVVEQYNYAKVTPISPTHGLLINFTDNEVGAIQPATQDSIIDVYSKQVAVNWGLNFNGVDQAAFLNPLISNIVLGSINFAFYFDFYYKSDIGVSYALESFRSSGIPFIRLQTTNLKNQLQFGVRENATGDATNSTINFAEDFQDGERVRLIVSITDPTNTSNWSFFSNKRIATVGFSGSLVGGISIDISALFVCRRNTGAPNKEWSNFTWNQILFFDDFLILEEIFQLLKNGTVNTSKLVEQVNFEKTSSANVETLLGNQLALENFNLSNFDNYYVEKDSALPEIKEGLLLNNSQIITFPSDLATSLSDNQIAFVISLKYQLPFSNPTSNELLLNTAGPRIQVLTDGRIRFNNRNVFDYKGAADPIPESIEEYVFVNNPLSFDVSNQANTIFANSRFLANRRNISAFTFDGTSITISGIPSGVYILRFDIYKLINRNSGESLFRNNDKKNVVSIYNNSLLSSKQNQWNLQASYRLNSNAFIEDGVDVKLIEALGNSLFNANVTGFTGATPADQLADLLTNIVKIDSLR